MCKGRVVVDSKIKVTFCMEKPRASSAEESSPCFRVDQHQRGAFVIIVIRIFFLDSPEVRQGDVSSSWKTLKFTVIAGWLKREVFVESIHIGVSPIPDVVYFAVVKLLVHIDHAPARPRMPEVV